MTDETASSQAASPSRRAALLWTVIPFLVLAAAIAWLFGTNPLRSFENGAPPVENLTYERTTLDGGGVRLLVRAGGSEPLKIAQVQVDAAYWQFTLDPPGPLPRGQSAWISIPFPWVLGEAHRVTVVTSTGTTFEHEIPVAVPTPEVTSNGLWSQAILGAFVGTWLLPRVGIHLGTGIVSAIVNATVGSVILLLAIRLVAGARN